MSQLGSLIVGVLAVLSAPPCGAQAPTPRGGPRIVKAPETPIRTVRTVP